MVLRDITSSTCNTVKFLQKNEYSKQMYHAQVHVLKAHVHYIVVNK